MPHIKYSSKIVKQIIGFLKEKPFRTYACKKVGIGYDTLLKWMREHADFDEAIKKAETAGKEVVKDFCLSEILSNKQWTSRAWVLERWFGDEFILKTKSEMSGYIESGQTEAERVERKEKISKLLNEIVGSVKSNKKSHYIITNENTGIIAKPG